MRKWESKMEDLGSKSYGELKHGIRVFSMECLYRRHHIICLLSEVKVVLVRSSLGVTA